jgi:hypothetical protein
MSSSSTLTDGFSNVLSNEFIIPTNENIGATRVGEHHG